MIGAGQLNRRVVIEEPQESANSFGERLKTWVELDTVWARVEPVSAREAPIAKSYAMTTSHVVTIRYKSDLKPTHRVRIGTRILGIDGIVDVEDAHVIQRLYCSEQSS